MRFAGLLPGSVVLTLCRFAAAATEEAQVDALFAKLGGKDAPGCGVTVVKGTEVLLQKGYGSANLEHGAPITPKTVFYMASTSKHVVAMSAALLVTKGLLRLSDDVRKWVPELPAYNGKTITVQHLLDHTSGLPDFVDLWDLKGLPIDGVYQEDDVFQILQKHPVLTANPGQRFSYTNSGYFLLGLIIKRISGMTLREFANHHFFQPLAMTRTHFRDDHTEVVPGRAEGYVKEGKRFRRIGPNFDLVGSGGLMSSMEDLGRWEINIHSQKIGGPSLFAMLSKASTVVVPSVFYGWGMFHGTYRGEKMVRHQGEYEGYRAHYLRLPRLRFSVYLACNHSQAMPDRLAMAISDIYLGLPPRKPGPSEETPGAALAPPDERDLAICPGTYFSNALDVTYTVEKTKVDGKDSLVLSFPWHPRIPLGKAKTKGPSLETADGRTLRCAENNLIVSSGVIRDLFFTRMPKREQQPPGGRGQAPP